MINNSTAHTAIRMSLRPNRLKYSSDGENARTTAAQTAPLSPMSRRMK